MFLIPMVIGNMFLRPDGNKKDIKSSVHTQDVKIDSLPYLLSINVEIKSSPRWQILSISLLPEGHSPTDDGN